MKLDLKKTVLAWVLGLLFLASGASAWGRAGGGHSYGGYGGGSRSFGGSSSFGGGSAGFGRSSFHVGTGTRHAQGSLGLEAVLVLVAIIVVWALLQERVRRDRLQTTRAIEALPNARRDHFQTAQQIAEGLARISARDPSFTSQALLLSAERAFVNLQHAWSSGQLEEARHLVSDGVLRRFTVQLALDRLHGRRNAVADPRVLEASVVAVESDDTFDTAHVRFRASLRDVDVPANTPQAEALSRAARAPASTFTEVWSFVRRLDATGARGDGKCPSCGAPVPRTAVATCEYCQAVLNSGAYDWVLAEITQEGEFRLHSAEPVEGFARLKSSDPALQKQVLEDRASLVFWKWIEALASGNPRRFARLCSPRSLSDLQSVQGKPVAGFERAAIGGVELALVETDAEGDRAHFILRWSTSGAGSGIVRTSVLSLTRAPGVKTNAKSGMSTDRCHQCAAPQKELDAAECSHCGAVLSRDWAFEELGTLESFQAARQQAQREMLALTGRIGGIGDVRERRRTLAAMVAVARADGMVTERERKLLEACARRWQIEPGLVGQLLRVPAEALLDLAPRSLAEARVLFRALAAAGYVDGRLDPEERRLLHSTAEHLKLPPEEERAILRELGNLVAAAQQVAS